MYLKRLELSGFKTFAERTTLEFGPGITAIVGPNGSGKSNISDGLLWVLGEQGLKALRSAKSIDVIFNGSDGRKALGMAEVHLTLDNATGFLPTDFTEVTVTRRVFRSSESEYLINRTPVRLRDVQELFMDTGIGKHSYSIISQGEVDAVLSSRSEDRRALFEEAAGITKYKQRKKEALRKLEQTRQNLLRVSDVISELESQVGPLAEQSEVARQYQVLHAELIELQLALLVAQYTGLQSSLARAREREVELGKEQEGLRHALGQIEIRETTLRAELTAMEDELEERRGLEHRLASAVQAAEGRITLLKQQEEQARRERERLRDERDGWLGEAELFDGEIAAADTEIARLHEAITGLEAELADADAAVKDAASAVDALAVEIQARRGVYYEALDAAAKMRNELARVESLLRSAEGRTTRIAVELAEIARKLQETKDAQAAAKARVAERQCEREKLVTARATAARARQQAVEALATARKEENRVREELAGMRARQRTLQELEESLEGYFPGVRAVAAAVQAGRLTGWYAPVSELLEVPAELETAIEVALGANLQDIVTDTEQSARAAVALLKSAQAGRATFLPLDLIAPAPRADVPAFPGILGLAMDLIGYEAEFEKIAQHQLGRVVIARDLDAALALAKAGSAKGWNRIVTLEGEVVHPSRAITGGSLGKFSGLLKRKRELQELTEGVARMERESSALQRKAQEAAAEVARLEAEMNALAKASEDAAVSVADAERALAAIGRDVAALEERRTALTEEAEWMARELTEAKAEETKLIADLDALEVRRREAEEAVDEAERALAGGQQDRDAITERYASLRLRVTEERGTLHARQAAKRRATEMRDNLAERLANNAKAAEAQDTKLVALTAQQQEAAAELLRQRQAYAAGSAEVEEARNRRATLMETIAANLQEQKDGRDAIEECQARLHRANLRTTQVETELSFLEGSFFEDYRLTVDQAVAKAAPVENRGVAVARLRELQAAVEEMGPVNLGAIEEYARIHERLTFLTAQRTDLEEGRARLVQVIAEIDATCKEKFLDAFEMIKREFQDLFVKLFGGGNTELSLTDPSDVLESGIEIHVTIPGKRNQHLLQLSGGERALTALALLFAMLRVKPSPFVVLDEIDAPLDEANVGRYCDVLREFTADTQFLIITHNKGTMEAADVLYGVTMEKAGVSKIVSVRLSEAQAEPVAAG
jgi:chromosome segregation protein